MSKQHFLKTLTAEIERIDNSATGKRQEKVIEGFTSDSSPRALINSKEYLIFNSNDYLGLRFNPQLKQAEHETSNTFGTGPGAVRFISGSLKIHRDLEQALAQFHKREDDR